jgi:hypothetical protein
VQRFLLDYIFTLEKKLNNMLTNNLLINEDPKDSKEFELLVNKFKQEAEDFNINTSEEEIKNAIRTFQAKFLADPNVAEKNISKYSLTKLLKLVTTKPGFGASKPKIEPTPDIVYNEDGIVIYSGDVEDKCIKYGAGEKWCITKGSFGNYRYDAGRGYPIFYLVKNTNLPDNDPLSFVAIQVRNNGRYVYTNRKNNPHESNEMSFSELLNEVPYLNSIDNIQSVLKYVAPNLDERNTERKYKNGIPFNEWSTNLDFDQKKLYLSIRTPAIFDRWSGEKGMLFTNMSLESFVTKVLPKYDKLAEWIFQNPWIFGFNILLDNMDLFKPKYQNSLLSKVNAPGHPTTVTGNDIINKKFNFDTSKRILNKIPPSKDYNFYLSDDGSYIVNVSYSGTQISIDIITEDDVYKDIKLSKRTQKYLFDYPNIYDIPLSALAATIKNNDLDSSIIKDIINISRESNDSAKKTIKVDGREILFDTSGDVLKIYEIVDNNIILPEIDETVRKAEDIFIKEAANNEEIQQNVLYSLLNNNKSIFGGYSTEKILENVPKEKLLSDVRGIVAYNNNIYSFVVPSEFAFNSTMLDNYGKLSGIDFSDNEDIGKAYRKFLTEHNLKLDANIIKNIFRRATWNVPYSKKVAFASIPDLPYDENSNLRMTVKDGIVYLVNTDNPAESFKISSKTGKILDANFRAGRGTTPAQLGAGERVAAPVAGAGRRGRPAGGSNRPAEGNISDDLTDTLTNSNLLDSFNQLPLSVRSKFFGDSTRGNLRTDRGVSRRDNLLGNLGHVDYVRIVGPSALYGIQLESGNLVASIVAQPGNSHWILTSNGAYQLDSPSNLVDALAQRNLTEVHSYLVNEFLARNPKQINELRGVLKNHIEETKNK